MIDPAPEPEATETEPFLPGISERGKRLALGFRDPLDMFLEKTHSLGERIGIATAMDMPVVKLESMIACATSGHPQTVLKNRLNLHLHLKGAGKKYKGQYLSVSAAELNRLAAREET